MNTIENSILSDDIEEKSLEDIINSIEDEEEKNIVSSQDLVPIEKKDLDVTDQDEIAKELVDMVQGDRKKADEVFDLFYGNLATDADRTTSSKEALTKALELKIEASKNILELAKIKARAEEQGSKVGVFFGGISAEKAGFNPSEIREVAAERTSK